MEPGDRQGCDEVRPHLRHDDELAVRLALAGGQLGEELVVGDARRCGQTRLLQDPGADRLRRGRGGRQAPPVFRNVEVGLIERQRLDQRGVSAKMAWIWRETAR